MREGGGGHDAAGRVDAYVWSGFNPSYEPGVIPLRPLAVGEILDGAVASLRESPKATLGLSFAVVAAGQLASLGLTLALRDGGAAGQLLVSLAGLVITGLMIIVLSGALAPVVSEAVLGTRVAPGEALRRLRGRVMGVIGVSVLTTVLAVLALALAVVGAVWVYVLLALAAPAYVLERSGVRAALRRSTALVRGDWWRSFGVLMLGTLVYVVVGAVLSLPFSLAAAGSEGLLSSAEAGTELSTGALVLSTVGGIVAGTVATPIAAGVTTLLYVDQRMRKEALDLTLAGSARQRRPG